MFKAQDVLQPAFIQRHPSELWPEISPLYAVDESRWLAQLMPLAEPSDEERAAIDSHARALIERVRGDRNAIHLLDALLLEYGLDTDEGILLMCLAEALMRIPDRDTADALIRDKLTVADWKTHLKNSDYLLVNASTWGLMLGKRVIAIDPADYTPAHAINRLVSKLSEPVVRTAMNAAMAALGHQFVLGRTIGEAIDNARPLRNEGFTHSYDMLGEAALTGADAGSYLDEYISAVRALGADPYRNPLSPAPTISIKLSALHPRYEAANEARVLGELYQAVLTLLRLARELNVGITIDAEEADRLELSLKLFEKLYRDPAVRGWGRFGLVVQAYSKRALAVLAWLAALSRHQGDIVPVRLVKGAYWDTELKLSQQRGLDGYPVYTRKEGTDTAYLACARFMLREHMRGVLYPQFASHNAHTVASIIAMAGHRDFEFQRLHGMGQALYQHTVKMFHTHVRIYAPVGSHEDLLPYLVRRLLENGANSSFVYRLIDADCPVESLIQHPVDVLRSRPTLHNDRIPLPEAIFAGERKNSAACNLNIEAQWRRFDADRAPFLEHRWRAGPVINGETLSSDAQQTIRAPYQHSQQVGTVDFATAEQARSAIDGAADALPAWAARNAGDRAQMLERTAALLEQHSGEFIALCQREAGKTLQDSIDEIREAVDFCRYYAHRARKEFGAAVAITGHDGADRHIEYRALGVFVCISPWNFPLAIFVGQVAAALAAGNTVVAKPAEQTSLIAARATALMRQAGVPANALQLVPGTGATVGAALTADPRVAGVAFTGSTATARHINRALAAREAEPAALIAETGGQNAMIVDSTALPEQVVLDVIRSAFSSAGQRCSALRVLFVQQDIAGRITELIQGAMAELSVGDPWRYSTDIGPVIDLPAKQKLDAHIAFLRSNARLVAEATLGGGCGDGSFVAPIAFEIDSMAVLREEHFGPILHIVRYKASQLDEVIEQINASGFGLTLGVHSRNERAYRYIERRARVGNCYINRDQVGAVVGVQPFGGQGLSGTGPKAGGPRYLHRFVQAVAATASAAGSAGA